MICMIVDHVYTIFHCSWKSLTLFDLFSICVTIVNSSPTRLTSTKQCITIHLATVPAPARLINLFTLTLMCTHTPLTPSHIDHRLLKPTAVSFRPFYTRVQTEEDADVAATHETFVGPSTTDDGDD